MVKNKWYKSSFALAMLLFIFFVMPFVLTSGEKVSMDHGDPASFPVVYDWFCFDFFKGNFQVSQFFFPNGINMAQGYDFPLLIALSCPLKPLGPLVMFNFSVFLTFFLVIWAPLYAGNKIFRQPLLTCILCLGLWTSSFVFYRISATLNLLSLMWILPLATMFFFEVRRNNIKSYFHMNLLFGLGLFFGWPNIPILFLAWFCFTIVIFKQKNLNRKVLIKSLFGAGALILPLIWIFVWPIIRMQMGTLPYRPDATSWYFFNSDLINFVLPFRDHYFFVFFENFLKGNYQPFWAERSFIPDPVLVLFFWIFSVFYLIKDKKSFPFKIFWVLAALGLILSLGPQVRWNDVPLFEIPGYAQIFNSIPFSMNRIPGRYGVLFTFFSLVWFLLAIDHPAAAKKPKYLPFCIAALASYLIFILVYYKVGSFPFYRVKKDIPIVQLRMIVPETKKDNGALLYLPLALNENPHHNLMQVYHKRPVISLYLSHSIVTKETLEFLSQDSLLKYMDCSGRTFAYDSKVSIDFPTAEAFVKYLRDLGIKFVVLDSSRLKDISCLPLMDFLKDVLVGSLPLQSADSARYEIYEL